MRKDGLSHRQGRALRNPALAPAEATKALTNAWHKLRAARKEVRAATMLLTGTGSPVGLAELVLTDRPLEQVQHTLELVSARLRSAQ